MFGGSLGERVLCARSSILHTRADRMNGFVCCSVFTHGNNIQALLAEMKLQRSFGVWEGLVHEKRSKKLEIPRGMIDEGGIGEGKE